MCVCESVGLSVCPLQYLKNTCTNITIFYFAHWSGGEILWWVCVCVSVCLSVREDIPGTIRAIFTKFFVHVAHVRGSVLLRHVDDRPHRLSPGRGWRECTARAKCNLWLPCQYMLPVVLARSTSDDNAIIKNMLCTSGFVDDMFS